MKSFCVLATCALILGGLIACQDAGSPQTTDASAKSSVVASENMDKTTQILAAIEEAGRYVDFTKGKIHLKVLTDEDTLNTVIEVAYDYESSSEPSIFTATVNADGSLDPHNGESVILDLTSAEADVKALRFGIDDNPRFPILYFFATISNHADNVEILVTDMPDSYVVLRVSGDEVSVVARGR